MKREQKTRTRKLQTCAMIGLLTAISGSAICQWQVYELTHEAKHKQSEGNMFQKTVDAFVERGMISPEMEQRARIRAQQQHDAWVEGFTVKGEASIMSSGTELSHSFPLAGVAGGYQRTFDFADGRLTSINGRYEIQNLGPTYPASSPLAWLVLGGRMNNSFEEVSRDVEGKSVVFQRDRAFGNGVDRVKIMFDDPQMTRWHSGEEWVVYPGSQPKLLREWSFTGEFGEPGYVATARLFDGNGDNWRTYKFEFVRTDSSGFSPESIPIGTMITDHRTPDGQPSLRYEWDGTFADVSQHAGGGFPVAGWYALSALGFAALGVYFWRKR